MDTKQIGDIAEQAVLLFALRRGWNVLRPIGDRLPYDIVFTLDNSKFIRVQVKSAWREKDGAYRVDSRRAKTNREVYRYDRYSDTDFDFCVCFVPDHNVFYVFPSKVFCSYGSGVRIVEGQKARSCLKSLPYREAWTLVEEFGGVEQPGSSSGS